MVFKFKCLMPRRCCARGKYLIERKEYRKNSYRPFHIVLKQDRDIKTYLEPRRLSRLYGQKVKNRRTHEYRVWKLQSRYRQQTHR